MSGKPVGNYRHVLAATDFSSVSERVVWRAAEVARCNGAQLTLLHVIAPLDHAMVAEFDLSEHLDLPVVVQNYCETEMRRLAELVGFPDAPLLMRNGSPKREIARAALELGVDLIVVGSHGRHGLDLLVGSTAIGVAHRAKCDMLTVRLTE